MFTIVWDDENCCDSFGRYETIEEAKTELKNNTYDSVIDMACMDNNNCEIEWDDDRLGFLAIMWTGSNKDDADDYFERTYRVHEIDADGSVIDWD